ncbi:PREDICTED: protein AHNAK2 [Condylura cristata]|uniref:protein AHNAK2 n=1 Tax=Condylura cristata TaxID=143302 RepID=UPI000642D465|nr:PREDICTED: protein AHNAK2 [Condylura cristata]
MTGTLGRQAAAKAASRFFRTQPKVPPHALTLEPWAERGVSSRGACHSRVPHSSCDWQSIFQDGEGHAGPGRQLQPEEPDADTEDDRSVTAGAELVRPQPQGSSPVYECVTEAGSGLLGDAPGRPASSGRRRSWWRRDSGESRASPRMSSPEDAPEVTLETKAEAGASGYSVAGGGSQGLFVKHVLKASSAAKLFNLRPGDQLLSATIFFDDIKYEDALKILQYSEPYRVQFQIRRKLPARQDEDWPPKGDQRAPRGPKRQVRPGAQGPTPAACLALAAAPNPTLVLQLQEAPEGAPGTPATPAKTLDADSDQDRLLGPPARDRGRQPQRERLSWPKFQVGKGRRQPGPRRSRSSSEAQDLSPTSTDPGPPLPPEKQPRGRLRSLRLRLGAGKGSVPPGGAGTGARTQLLQDPGPWDEGWGDPGVDGGAEAEGETPGAPQATATPGTHGQTAPSSCGTGAQGREAPVAPTWAGKDRGEDRRGDTLPGGRPAEGPGTGLCDLEAGIARLSLQDTPRRADTTGHTQGSHGQLRGPEARTKGDKGRGRGAEGAQGAGQYAGDAGAGRPGDPAQGGPEPGAADGRFSIVRLRVPAFGVRTPAQAREEAGEEDETQPSGRADQGLRSSSKGQETACLSLQQPPTEADIAASQGGRKLPEAQEPEGETGHPELGAELKGHQSRLRTGGLKMPKMDFKPPQLDTRDPNVDTEGGTVAVRVTGVDMSVPGSQVDVQAHRVSLEGDIGLGDTEVTPRDKKFKMPKLRMPSFGMSTMGKSAKAPVETNMSVPSIQGDVQGPDLSLQQPSDKADIEIVQVGVKLPEAQEPEGETGQPELGAGLKGHLPKLKTGSLKMPKVDFKTPQLDIRGPSVDKEAIKVVGSVPEGFMSMPSSQDIQAQGVSLEGDIGLGDTEVTSRDSKFKMPKLKMPSFGVSTTGKSGKALVEAEMSLPSMQRDAWGPDLSLQRPSTEADMAMVQVGLKRPEVQVPKGETGQPELGAISMKMPKEDIKPPELDIRGSGVDLECTKAVVSVPEVDMTVPVSELDVQAPGVNLAADISLRDTDVTSRDSKFKMPKLKMPSFGVSTTGKSAKAPIEADISVPSMQRDVQGPDLSLQQPSAKVDITTVQVGVKLPVAQVPKGEMIQPELGAGLKGHLPKLKTGSLKMPKVDFKAPQLDISGPSVDTGGGKMAVRVPDMDMSVPGSQVDIQAQAVSVEGEIGLGDTEVTSRDSKFKMPKFKMPSFGMSTMGKSAKAPVEMDMSVPSMQGNVQGPDLSLQKPSANMDITTVQMDMKLPEAQMPEGEMDQPELGAGLKGHLPKLKTGSLKMPKVDFKPPQLDVSGHSVDMEGGKLVMSVTDMDMSVPGSQVDVQPPGVSLEGDIGLGDTDVTARDKKFKMPKLKMPSFSVSTTGKSEKALVKLNMSVPSMQGEVQGPDLSLQMPLADVDITTVHVGVKMPEAQVIEGETFQPEQGAGLQGHLPKLKTGSLQMPKVPQLDISGPSVDLEGSNVAVSVTDVDMSMPGSQVDIQAQGILLEGDIGLGDTEVTSRDSKFKMPKPKMPSFGVSTTGKSVKAPVEADMLVPSMEDVQGPDLSLKMPSANMDITSVQVDLKMPEVQESEGETSQPELGAGLKGHLPKLKTGSLKMPKVDIKPPQLDIRGPSVDREAIKVVGSVPEESITIPSSQVAIQAPGASLKGDIGLEDTEMTSRDSKFKMPKLKMPSFGVSTTGKSGKALVEADMSVPSMQGDVQGPDLSLQMPSVDVDITTVQVGVKLPEVQKPEGETSQPELGAGLKGHLPKLKTGSLKMPKVDFKPPQLDLSSPIVDMKGGKVAVSFTDVDMSMPGSQVDVQAQGVSLEGDIGLGDTEVTPRDSKFKMPKLKMPSFGVSPIGKSGKAPVEADMSVPSMQGDVQGPDLSLQMPSADVDITTIQVGVKLPEAQMPEGETGQPELGSGLKGHLPKLKTGSLKMPKVDFKPPQLDISGPSVDMGGSKVVVSFTDVDMSMPSSQVDVQAQGVSLEGDIGLGDTEVTSRDSKFKIPKLRMPSFSVSTTGKSAKAPVEADMSVPSMQGDVQGSDLSLQMPPAEADITTVQVGVKLPEAQVTEGETGQPKLGARLKGHLPKLRTGSLQKPKVPQLDISGPRVDLESTKLAVSVPDEDNPVPGSQVDVQAPGVSLEGEISFGDTEVTPRDSKFKMPKLKMPSFGMSTTGKSVKAPVEADMSLPSMQGDVQGPDLSLQMPSADVDITTIQVDVKLPEAQVPEGETGQPGLRAGLKGHLPKLKTGSLKMPKVDIKPPQLDIRGPSVDREAIKVVGSVPEESITIPSSQVAIQSPGVSLEGDIGLGDMEMTPRDSKFKMPKPKMPSFGVSTTGKSAKAPVEADMSVPSMQGDVQGPDLSLKMPSADVDITTIQVDVKLPEAQVPEGETGQPELGSRLKGHLPNLRTGSLQMPKVPQLDISGPRVDLESTKLAVSVPDEDTPVQGSQVDNQAQGVSLEGDISLGDTELTSRDNKFKMPKLKMPSFGVSTMGKSVKAPDEADMSVPSMQGDVQGPDLSLQMPSADVDITTVQAGVKLPEAQVPEEETGQPELRAGLKGHLPKLKTGSLKMPKVDIKPPQLDISGPIVDMKGGKGAVSFTDVDMSVPSSQVDVQAQGVSLEGDIGLGDTEVTSRDSKFKMPKFKMPSFGVSPIGKSGKAPVEADMSVLSMQGDVQGPDLSLKMPLAEADIMTIQDGLKLPEVQEPEGETSQPELGAGLKGHLPKLKTGSLKMPKVDFKTPQLDIRGPSVDREAIKVVGSVPEESITIPSSQVAIQAPGVSLKGDIGVEDTEMTSRDSKFKMPKLKMPSFGVSTTGMSGKALVEADMSMPSMQGDIQGPDLSLQMPSDDVDITTIQVGVKLPEAQVPEGETGQPELGSGLKGHLPKLKTGSLKMPKVDFKAPQLDISGPSVDMGGSKVAVIVTDVDMSVPSSEVDVQAQGVSLEGDIGLGVTEVSSRDSKFKMPKFKMPSLSMSTMSKSAKAPVEADMSVPSMQGDVQVPDLSLKMPSAEVDITTVQVGLKLPEALLTKGETGPPELGAGLKGHLPKLRTGSLQMPKVPQLDISGPRVDREGTMVAVSVPDKDIPVPGSQVDVQVPGVSLEGDISFGDTEVTPRDSKFKMPKLKMPSFGVSTTGNSAKARVEADNSLPSMPDVQGPDLSLQGPSAVADIMTIQVGMKLPEAQVPEGETGQPEVGAGLKGLLPKLKTGSLKMSKVPQMDIRASSVDMEGGKLEVSVPDVDICLPGSLVDVQEPGVTLAGNISLGVKEVTPRDSKFKMPKLRMPSFGVSTTGKSAKASVEAEMSLPSMQGDVQGPDLSLQMPSARVDIMTVQVGVKEPEVQVTEGETGHPELGAGVKGHLPKPKTSSLKMPKVDIQPSQLDISDLSVDMEGGKVAVNIPDVDMSMPGSQVVVQAQGISLEGDIGLGDTEVTPRDSKFKMPKLKMPSFGMSTTGKSAKAPVESDMSLLSMKGDVQGPDLSLQIPSAEVDVMTVQVGVKLPEAQVPEGETGHPELEAGLKGHLPKLKTGSLKMPKMDFKPPQVDIRGPSMDLEGGKVAVSGTDVDMSMPVSRVDVQARGVSLEGDIGLGDTEVTSRDSKFKIPKLKMPSFGMSTTGKSAKAPVEADMSLLSMQGDVQGPDPSLQMPSADVDITTVQVGVKLPEAQVTEGETGQPKLGARLKGDLPKLKTGSLKVPKVDSKPPQLDIRRTSVDMEGVKVAVRVPDGDMSVPGSQVDIQAPRASLAADMSLGVKEVTSRDSKFKMPKLKMPSFGMSTTGKSVKAPVEADMSLPSMQGDVQGPVVSLKMPSADVDITSIQVGLKLPEVQVTEGETGQPELEAGLESHLPNLKTDSLKMPDVDFKAPQLDIMSPRVDVEAARVEVSAPAVDVDPGVATVLAGSAEAPSVPPTRLPLGPGGVCAWPPAGDADPQPPCAGPGDAEALAVGSPLGAAQAGVRPAQARDSWFHLPSFHLPGLRRGSSKGPGGAGVQGEVQGPPAGEGTAGAGHDPRPGAALSQVVCAPVSRLLPEAVAATAAAESASYADVLRRPVVSTGWPPHPAPAGWGSLQAQWPRDPDSVDSAAAGPRAASGRPAGLLRLWFPSLGFSAEQAEAPSAGTAQDPPPAPEPPGQGPEAGPPKRQEKGGWFRLPKLGFSSSPSKKSQRATGDGAALAEQNPQEETVTFFDARDCFSPEEEK